MKLLSEFTFFLGSSNAKTTCSRYPNSRAPIGIKSLLLSENDMRASVAINGV